MYKKRIVLLTHDSVYSRKILNYLLKLDNIEIVGIVLSTCIVKRGENTLIGILRLLKKSGIGL